MTELDDLVANLRDHWLAKGSQDPFESDPALFRTGLAHEFLNGVVRLRMGHVADVLPEVRRRLGGVPWLWHVGPDSAPHVADELMAAGAGLAYRVPIMAVPLDEVAQMAGPEGFNLSETTDVAEWTALYGGEFGWHDELIAGAMRMEAERRDEAGTLRRYSGRVGGDLAGTIAVLDRHDVAGVYSVATHHDWRRRGVGGRMVGLALAAARERGLTRAVLESSPDGVPLYEKLGFTQVAESRWFKVRPNSRIRWFDESTDHLR